MGADFSYRFRQVSSLIAAIPTWPLLSSALQTSTKTEPNAAFTIVTGDLLVHHFREQFNAAATIHDDAAFRSFVRKTVEFVGLQAQTASPRRHQFSSLLGNNDDVCGDYAIQPGGPFLQDTSQVIGDLARLSNTDSYVQLGSYSAPSPAVKHQRIVVLDTVFFSPRYSDLCGQGAGDAGDRLLAWLANELESAKARHDIVWLVYHVPPGVDAFATTHAKVPGNVTLLWKDSYLTKFLSLLDHYRGVVGAQFAGHVHVDDFRLLDRQVVLVAPAISPITGQNPTFRTVRFDSHGRLQDQATYYLTNLAAAGQGAEPVWRLEYDFDKEWRLKGLNAQSYATLFARFGAFAKRGRAMDTVLYSTSHVASSLTPDSFHASSCASGNISAQAYQSCAAEQIGK